MDNNQVVNNTPEQKKNNNTMIFLIAGVILVILGIVLFFTVFNKGGSNSTNENNSNANTNTNTNTNTTPEDDGIEYKEQSAPGSFDDIGKYNTGIIYGDGKKAKVLFTYVDNKLTEVSVNGKSGIFIGDGDKFIGAYQISDSIVLIRKNGDTGITEAYCYKLDGEFLMLQEITVPNMKYTKMEVNGNNIDFYFTMHSGTTIDYNGKKVNACNAQDLSNNNLNDNTVVEEVFRINYTDDDASFHMETPELKFKSVADLKKNC